MLLFCPPFLAGSPCFHTATGCVCVCVKRGGSKYLHQWPYRMGGLWTLGRRAGKTWKKREDHNKNEGGLKMTSPPKNTGLATGGEVTLTSPSFVLKHSVSRKSAQKLEKNAENIYFRGEQERRCSVLNKSRHTRQRQIDLRVFWDLRKAFQIRVRKSLLRGGGFRLIGVLKGRGVP